MRIEHRAKKNLEYLVGYETASEEDEADLRREYGVQTNEKPLGLYLNSSGDDPESILVTTEGLRLKRKETNRFVRYSDIVSISSPTKTPVVTTLYLEVTGGETVNLAITGFTGRFRDIFGFLHYLMRAIETPPHRRLPRTDQAR